MATHEHQIYAPYDYTFDVYLSFRGSNNRWNFAANLRHALNRKGFNIFMDDDGIMIGSSISLALLKALEGSRISIVVFSEDFASSTWCLDELVQMLECRKATNQRIFPIFYRVDPSDVRRQRGSFGEAMVSHEHRFGEDSVMLEIWKSALTEIANLSGYAPRYVITGEVYYYILGCLYIDTYTPIHHPMTMIKRKVEVCYGCIVAVCVYG